MSQPRPPSSAVRRPAPPLRRILGVNFYRGDLPELIELTQQGGLIVVPSAPVLVNLADDAAHREALEGADFALTDSGFMVWLWLCRTGEWLKRISGLKYLRALLEEPDFRRPGATYWVMPSARDAAANLGWLRANGVAAGDEDYYVAPDYPRGPLRDGFLLADIEQRKPRYIVICLGGGVQERLGYYLKRELEKAPGEKLSSDRPPSSVVRPPSSESSFTPSTVVGLLSSENSPDYRPAIICTGAAIAFLSGRQAGIPPWADRLMLGWLLRCLEEPGKFIPRYWKALRLVSLLFRFRDRGVASLPEIR